MEKFIELIKQRRFWASVAGSISLVLMAIGAKYQLNIENLTDLLNNLGIATANILTIILPLLSYLFPKKVK